MEFIVSALALAVLLCSSPVLGLQEIPPPDHCIAESSYTKPAPSPETEEFAACQLWQNNSCCTPNTTRKINETGYVELYDFTWAMCGPLSQECQDFMQNEACFYECEPRLGVFQPPGVAELNPVPVCASYCNSWFEACRNDMTCVKNWWQVLLEADESNRLNTCPARSECRTFEAVYGDGRTLCDTIWEEGYFYSEDINNCALFTFDASMPNPNSRLVPVGVENRAERSALTIAFGVMMALAFLSSAYY